MGVACGLLFSELSTAHVAGAETDQAIASRLFQAGVAAFEAADFVVAAHDFDAADHLVPSGQAVVNAARSWRAAGEAPHAADEYAAALKARSLSADNSSIVRKELDALEQKLGIVRVTFPVGGAFSVGDAIRSPVPGAVHLRPGPYEVDIEGPGGVHLWRHVLVSPHGMVTLEAPLPPTASAPSPEANSQPSPVPSAGSRWVRPAGWIGLGSAAAFAATAGLVGYLGLQARDRFDDSGHIDVPAHEQALTFRTLANVGWVACGAAAVTGTVLLLWPLRPPAAGSDQGSRSLLLTPAGVAVRGTF